MLECTRRSSSPEPAAASRRGHRGASSSGGHTHAPGATAVSETAIEEDFAAAISRRGVSLSHLPGGISSGLLADEECHGVPGTRAPRHIPGSASRRARPYPLVGGEVIERLTPAPAVGAAQQA